MAKLPLLEDVAAEFGGMPEADVQARIAALLAAPDVQERVMGVLLAGASAWRRSGPAAALEVLLGARASLGCMPLPVIHNLIDMARRAGREQTAAFECLAFARDAVAQGYADLGLEAASAAILLDTLGSFEILKNPEQSLGVAGLYEQVAQGLAWPAAAGLQSRQAGPPWRVALVVSNLVDHVVAHTKTVLHMARYADPDRYRISVISSENLAGRTRPLFPFGCQAYPSGRAGVRALAELGRRGVPVTLLSREPSFTRAARLLVEALEVSGAHMAVFQSGLASPIDWLAARLARVPVKAAIHIGSSLFNAGIGVTFFDNPANLERESASWPEWAGARVILPMGTDIAELDAQAPLDRAALGIPARAVVLGVMSNHLEQRLSESYLAVVADLLIRYPSVWFLALGAEPGDSKRAYFEARGVAARVRFAGLQRASGSALKLLDIYANEFPVGGCQAVVEAMACGLPVAAMRWSQAHAESAGAEAVGPPDAVPGPDPAAYAALLARWIESESDRREAGRRMRARAVSRFHVRDFVAAMLGRCESLLALMPGEGARA
jgi:hypothetical protein